MQYSIEVRAAFYCIEVTNFNAGCGTKHTAAYIVKSDLDGKFNYYLTIGLTDAEVLAKGDKVRFEQKGVYNTYAEAEAKALSIVSSEVNICSTLEVWADAANIALHTEIAAVAEADAAQYEAEQVAAENEGINFVQVYIDGLPSDWASAEVARYCVDYFLDAELPINETITFNGKTLYLEETILDTCFAHGGGVWEFWANPAHPDEKTLLMIYLRTTPVKARKKPRYPQETDYCDYRDGGDGYTSENMVLDF